MAGHRGRPRKIALPEAKKIKAQIAKENTKAATAPVLEPDHVPHYHKIVPVAARGGMNLQRGIEPIVQSNQKRLEEVLSITKRIELHGGSVQEHNNCVTVTMGKYSECANITTPDDLLNRLVDRVINAGGF